MCHRLAALKSLPPVTPQTILNSFEKGQHLTEVSQKWRSWLSADNSSMPQQVHIALNNDCTQMVVNWATLMPGVADGEVQWWPAEQPRPAQTVSAKAEISTYNAGVFGWSGTLYSATMIDLVPGQRYKYVVGSPSLNVWSLPFVFSATVKPSASASVKLAITADQGTIVPFGWAVADAIIKEHTTSSRPFDGTILSGDVSYATVSPPRYELESTWDAFFVQVEPYAATAPFMATVGNHEAPPGNITNSSGLFTDVWGAAFNARLTMPSRESGGRDNLWFSYNIGPIHVASLSSEHDYSPNSPQALWLEKDLSSVDRAVTPWVFVSLHRPIYSADQSEFPSHSPGGALANWLEPVCKTHKCDLMLQGHVHCAERIHAQFNGTVMTQPTNEGSGPASNTYRNPTAPVYIVQGTAGAFQKEHFMDPAPAWSAFRLNGIYGYGIMEVTGANLLEYRFVDLNGGVQDQWRIVKG